MPEAKPARLVITKAAQCRPLWLAYMAMLPTVGLFPLAAWALTTSRPGQAEAVPMLLLIASLLLPFALWRNRFTFDKGSGRLTHAWGYPFRWFGVREYALDSFTGLSIAGVKPYWATPQGPVTPLMHDHFPFDRRLYYHVLLEGREAVVVEQHHTFEAAVKARRRLGAFLEFAMEPAPTPQAFLGANAHIILLIAATPVGMIVGLGAALLLHGQLGAMVAGMALPIKTLVVIANLAFWPLVLVTALSRMVALVPAACPSCGAKARLAWPDALIPGLGWGRYRCDGCAAVWQADC